MAGDVKRRNFSNELDRRKFIGVAAATAGAMLIKPELVRGTAANSAVRVGLLGCGGRGTEDASNLVDTGNARVAALADMFQDQLENAKKHFDEMQQGKGYQAIDASQIFVGPKAYQQMAASKEVDAVVIATPPYYHPQHLEAIVAGGKHVYLEKPVAVDVPGALKVIEIGKGAEGKLSLDVGFQIRDCPPFVELVKRIHNGAIGNIVCGEAHYLAGYIDRPAWPNASPVEKRLQLGSQEPSVEGVCDRRAVGPSGQRRGRLRKLQRDLPLSRSCGRRLQLDAVRQRLVGCDGTLLRDKRNFAVALHRAAGRLG